ncbi:hypothetical protein [Thermosynechococcus vestitus]|nr:hypothetical protein [Thermosynechococcus vestitus]
MYPREVQALGAIALVVTRFPTRPSFKEEPAGNSTAAQPTAAKAGGNTS